MINPDISGTWEWVMNYEEDPMLARDRSGILYLQDEGISLMGRSFVEIFTVEAVEKQQSYMENGELIGDKYFDASGHVAFRFQIKNQYSETNGTAYIAENGNTLFGRSSTLVLEKFNQRSELAGVYMWLATRI